MAARTTKTPDERAIAWRRAEHARVCDVVEQWEHGTVFRATQHPDFWAYNGVRVEGPATSVGVDLLVHEADVRLGDMRHRQVEVEDEAAGARLRPGFAALGWTAERLVWMRLDGPGPPGRDFEEVPLEATRELRSEWSRSAPWGSSEEAVRQLAADEEDVAGLRGSRALIGRDEAGVPIAFAIFVAHDGTAEVDQAYVTPEHRGRGLGGAVVAAAVRAAAADVTYIVADDDGESKRLYARLGFRPVWLQHTFTRRPG
ncbi:MAG: GNAT family N-acetyltransferase [Solirubrobacteraceae bacterium]